MIPVDTKVLKLTVKLIGLICVAFLVTAYLPEFKHHLLLVISVALILIGLRPLLKYKEQEYWTENSAEVKSINELEEEVATSHTGRLKYYYPAMEYEYPANGSMHFGKTVSFEKENIWVPEVNELGDPTPKEKRWWFSLSPGDRLPVYINPRNTNEAVLIRNKSKHRKSHHLALIAGGIILGVIWAFLMKLT